MTREIQLTNGGVTFVDDEDFEWLSQWRWSAICERRYVARSVYDKGTKRVKITYIHRLILDPPEGMTTDHIDRDGFNNTRKNLRVATQGQNNRNRRVMGSSGYKGVMAMGKSGGWSVVFGSGQSAIRVGAFYDITAAARAYDAYAAMYGDEFTIRNFPHETPLTIAEVEAIRLQQHRLRPAKARMTSQYRGVSYYPTRRTWRAAIKHNGTEYPLGYFKTEVDGAFAYDQKARELLGEKAQLNFPATASQSVAQETML